MHACIRRRIRYCLPLLGPLRSFPQFSLTLGNLRQFFPFDLGSLGFLGCSLFLLALAFFAFLRFLSNFRFGFASRPTLDQLLQFTLYLSNQLTTSFAHFLNLVVKLVL